MGKPLPAFWDEHLKTWQAFRNDLLDLGVPLEADMAPYADPVGPTYWDGGMVATWRVQVLAFLPDNTGLSVDFSHVLPGRERCEVYGWGRSVSVRAVLVAPTPQHLDEVFGYTALLVGLIPDVDDQRCQPIGCDNGHHLTGCSFAARDSEDPA